MSLYLDAAATTEVKPEVLNAMMPYFLAEYGNPSSIYSLGESAKNAVENARKIIANKIGAKPEEIYFTSGGSEADNWALKGILKPGDHLITSKIEHHAILNTCKYLEDIGVEVTYLDVDSNGFVSGNDVEKAIKKNTKLISIMTANNEIGSIQFIDTIGLIATAHNILFHTDAVQAFGHIPMNVDDLNIDLMSVSGHKIGAPKGIGFLFVRNGIKIEPLIHGGKQERGLRGGTENVAGIVGLGKAVELISYDTPSYADMFIEELLKSDIYFYVNSPNFNRLPNTVNISFDDIAGESLLILLSGYGIFVSSGSACASGTGEESHVLKAIGLDKKSISEAIRFSFGEYITEDDVKEAAKIAIKCVKMLRGLK